MVLLWGGSSVKLFNLGIGDCYTFDIIIKKDTRKEFDGGIKGFKGFNDFSGSRCEPAVGRQSTKKSEFRSLLMQMRCRYGTFVLVVFPKLSKEIKKNA